MASLPQEQQVMSEIVPASWNIGQSNRIAAVDFDGQTPPHIDHDHQDPGHDKKPGWRKFVSFIGPGFLVSMAYIDPGSTATDLHAGAEHGYELLWVILIGFIFVLVIQSLAANLGVSTGKHLAELCKAEYPKHVRYCLWLVSETAVILADIPEVIGTAFALNILFHIPVWVGVLMTGCSTILLLGLQRYGVRKLEMLIIMLVFVMAGCFFGELGYVKPPATDVLKGLFVPTLSSNGATVATIAVLGALITPHNLFLHSALVLSRKVPNSVRTVNDACRFFLLESGVAILIAFLVNLSIIAVPGTVCRANNISPENIDRCNNLTLDSAPFLLKNVLGKSSSVIYAVALLASGQSSAITGTYAGQYIMQGFLDLRMKKWISNLLTRCIAITPSLIISIIGGPSGAAQLIIIASMLLLYILPFALIPLLRFSSSKNKMGPYKNSIYIMVISWLLALMMIGINMYYLITGVAGWLFHNHLPKVGKVFIGMIIFPLMAFYLLAIAYLTFRKDTVVTYTEPIKDNASTANLANIESGQQGQSNLELEMNEVPYREDLADIPLPE